MPNQPVRADDIHIDGAITNAHTVFREYKKTSPEIKVLFLKNIVAELAAVTADLVPVTQKETALPTARLEGEMQRTVKQINMFASLLEEGSWVRAVIDVKENPATDIRQMQVPLGVVAVFGASNFPFAFSVAGGDTISALAAGCPVVYKAHPGHPETSRIVAGCIERAAEKTGLPAGVFSMVEGGIEAGQQLVMHPLISAVAFTGSFRGGKALFDAATKRETPIPVYAEMGSVNPVFVLPRMLQQNSNDIAGKIIASNHQGVGQFCTNPGIVVLPPLHGAQAFITSAASLVGASPAGTMLTEGIHKNYLHGAEKLSQKKGVKVVAKGATPAEQALGATPQLFVTDADNFLNDTELHEELFGPASLFVETGDKASLYNIAARLQGQLTATVWGTDEDLQEFAELVTILEDKAGRLLINGVPTGVEVTAAMVHGGPYPATTDSRGTSVGSDAIYRFTRPVCYQNFPQFLLPDALKDANPLGIRRKVNGVFA